MRAINALALMAIIAPVGALARDNLGIFDHWGAFRDPQMQRCYAIARPSGTQSNAGYASIGFWPKQSIRAQFYLRLPGVARVDSPVVLTLGQQRYTLRAAGAHAWARTDADDAAIIAQMRSGVAMSVSGILDSGRAFGIAYPLRGAATAIDAAALGCSGR